MQGYDKKIIIIMSFAFENNSHGRIHFGRDFGLK